MLARRARDPVVYVQRVALTARVLTNPSPYLGPGGQGRGPASAAKTLRLDPCLYYRGANETAIASSRFAPAIHKNGFAMAAKGAGGPSKKAGETAEELCVLFGANFRQARLKAELTQADVAALTGIQQPYISDIENGLQNLTISTMVTMARAVGTDIRTLLRRSSSRS
jgi:predicted XRE-type DNA-binding protein